jgi:hypothetical protein
MIVAELESGDVATIWQSICAALAFSTTVVTIAVYRYGRKEQQARHELKRRKLEIEAAAAEREYHDKMLALPVPTTKKGGPPT